MQRFLERANGPLMLYKGFGYNDNKGFAIIIRICNHKTYDESSIKQQVLMDNHNKAKVLGKGTTKVNMSSGKMIILTNIFHIPDIKKNRMSTN